ncbi:MAG: hypothetical protein CMM47_04425 [Rhodospirillaceae bacterium]|nr:hypothetical protein [Rhodospirillaceae bacterium]
MDIDPKRFALLRAGERIWAIAAIRGDAERLKILHRRLAELFRPGDRVIYLGDVLGTGPAIREAVDELLRFRRWVLATPPFTHTADVVVLRGSQEEMWRTLLQIQFAAQPGEVLDWMAGRGVERTVEAYGGRFSDAVIAARNGPTALSQWTAPLRRAVRASPGHGEFAAMLLRAAITTDKNILLVNTGLDPSRVLAKQGDRFWWDPAGLERMTERHPEAALVVRGSDPRRRGFLHHGTWLNLDGGSGTGGPLNAICISPVGEILEHLAT